MTQLSWPWTCTNTGDGGTSSFTMDIVQFTSMLPLNIDPTQSGVIFWNDSTAPSSIANVAPFSTITNSINGYLVPSNPSGNTVRIASGVGMVAGWLYINDANVDFDVSGGNANATDIIVLRRDRTAQTVRLALVRGGAGGTATVTQTSATWEVKLCEVLLDGSGNFSSLTDTRKPAYGASGKAVKIQEVLASAAVITMPYTITLPDYPFTHLRVVVSGRSDGAFAATGFQVNFNADTGNNYDHVRSEEDSTSGTSVVTEALASGTITVMEQTGSTATANYPTTNDFTVYDYRNTIFYKLMHGKSVQFSGGGASAPQISRGWGWWQNTAKITSVRLALGGAGDLIVGSKITVYGIV